MVSAGRTLLSTWDGWDGMAQDRFSAQTGHSWLCRRVPGARRAAEGSWSLRPGSATALVSGRHAGRSHRPSSLLSHHIVRPCMFYSIICLGFFLLF